MSSIVLLLVQGHTITLNGNTCYVFGGLDGSKPPGPTNDIYLLKVRGGGHTLLISET